MNLFHLRFVSDHGPVGCQALLQHRLIQANQKAQVSSGSAPEASRTYPLSLLEWTANRKKANMVLQVHCFDGELHLLFDEDYLLYQFVEGSQSVQIKASGTSGKVFPHFCLRVGGSFLCPVHSWTNGEDLAGDILRHRFCSFWLSSLMSVVAGIHQGWRSGWGSDWFSVS